MLDKVSRSFLLRRSRDKSRSARSSGSSLLGVVASVATAAPVAGFAPSPFSTDRGLLPFDWWPVNGRKGQTIFTFSVACWLHNAGNCRRWVGEEERTCHVVAVEPIGKALLTWQKDQGGARLYALPV